MPIIFWIFVSLMALIGAWLLIRAYTLPIKAKNRKALYEGYLGAFFLLVVAGVIIYFYSQEPVSDRFAQNLERTSLEKKNIVIPKN